MAVGDRDALSFGSADDGQDGGRPEALLGSEQSNFTDWVEPPRAGAGLQVPGCVFHLPMGNSLWKDLGRKLEQPKMTMTL